LSLCYEANFGKTIINIIIIIIIVIINDFNKLPAEEQKGCIKNYQDCKEQLIIDSVVLEQAHKDNRNLYKASIDYRKAFDSVPHSWFIHVLLLLLLLLLLLYCQGRKNIKFAVQYKSVYGRCDCSNIYHGAQIKILYHFSQY